MPLRTWMYRRSVADLETTHVPLHLSVNVADDWIQGVEFGTSTGASPTDVSGEASRRSCTAIGA